MKKLFILEPVNPSDQHWGFDMTWALVVRSSTEDAARKLAVLGMSDKQAKAWLDETRTSCRSIDIEGPDEVILEDILHG